MKVTDLLENAGGKNNKSMFNKYSQEELLIIPSCLALSCMGRQVLDCLSVLTVSYATLYLQSYNHTCYNILLLTFYSYNLWGDDANCRTQQNGHRKLRPEKLSRVGTVRGFQNQPNCMPPVVMIV